jgi:hypothetical protein
VVLPCGTASPELPPGEALGSRNPGQLPQRIAFRRGAGPQPSDPCNKVILRTKISATNNELQRLEQLPWPRNPFGESASIAELTAELAHASEKADAACSCGCRKEHKQNVSQRLRNPYGRGFDLIYFRAEDCKYKWNRERRRRTGQ